MIYEIYRIWDDSPSISVFLEDIGIPITLNRVERRSQEKYFAVYRTELSEEDLSLIKIKYTDIEIKKKG